MVRKLPNTRCFMPSSRICLRMVGGRRLVAPDHDGFGVGVGDDSQRALEIGGPGKVFLFDGYGMSQAAGGVPEFDDAEAAVAVVDAQQRDAGQAQIGVDAPGQRVTLDAVVLERGQIPGDDGLGNGRVGGGGVDDGHLGLEADAEADVGGVGADRPEHGPDFVVVRHLDDLIAGRAPERLVVVHHELERRAAVASARVGLFDGQQRAVEHHAAERFIGMIFDGAQKTDAHFFDVLRLEGDCVAGRPVVLHLLLIVLVVRLGELTVGAQVLGRVGVGTSLAILRWAGRIGAAGTAARTPGLATPLRTRRPSEGAVESVAFLLLRRSADRKIAIPSISTSSSGRHRIAWIPVDAGSGSSSCSR